MKKLFFTILSLMLTLSVSAQTTVTFTAAEIVAGTTKSGITASTDMPIKTAATICKIGGTNQKADVVEVKSTAADVNQYYVQISSTSDITNISMLSNFNSSGSTPKDEAMLFWNTTTPSATASGETLIPVVGYDGDCTNRTVSPNIPSGTKSLRMYRQIKKYSTSAHAVVASGGANYGSGQTFYVESIEVTIGGTPGPVVSHDATLSALTVAGQTLTPTFAATTESYVCTLPFGTTAVPTVTYTTTDANATAVKTDATGVTGTTTIVVTAEDGTTTKTYTIQFSVAPDPTQPSNDATLSALTVAGNTISPAFSPLTTSYTCELPYGTTTVPTVTYTTNDTKASAVKTDATSTTGTTTIVVTAEDGTTKTYSITFSVAQPGPPVPPTTLTLHEPGVYEDDPIDNGYGANLVPFGGNMYEVYYMNRLKSGELTYTTEGTDQSGKIVTTSITATELRASDGWFHMVGQGPGGQSGSADEFTGYTRRADIKGDNGVLELRVKGFKEFALLGTDKKKGSVFGDANCKYLQISINGVNQVTTLDQIVTSYTVRRYALNPAAEYVIKVTGVGNDATRICGFSLAVGTAPNPKMRWIYGDTIQTVYSTNNIRNIFYHIKNDAGTTLEWTGTAIPGITLSKLGSDAKGDTLMVSGQANVSYGTYPFAVSAKRDGEEKARMNGIINVVNHIWAKGDVDALGYTGEAIDDINFGYYSINPTADIHLTWTNGAPAGISGNVVGSSYVISGTPTATGTFPYSISIDGGETITGTLTISTGGNHDILYLYKEIYPTNLMVDDQTFLYLQSLGYSVAARKQQSSGLRTDYSKYRMIVIAESADADNAEVLAVAQGGANKPVLNMKNFTYGPTRLEWGTPDVGTHVAADMTVTASHPIFTALGWANGSTHTLYSQVQTRGMMVVYDVTNGGTELATGYIRDRNYDLSGHVATFMQEIPATARGGKKYILLPMAYFSSAYMTQDAKNLIKQTIIYLLQ